MGYYDTLFELNSYYVYHLTDYQFDPKLYANWRSFLEITNEKIWELIKEPKNFESFDDFISFSILDYIFHIQDHEIKEFDLNLANLILQVDSKLLSYCQKNVCHNRIISILKSFSQLTENLILVKGD